MEKLETGTRAYQWYNAARPNGYSHRNEIINELSRSPVKVRHWLLTNRSFQVGLEALDPNDSSWLEDEKLRNVVKMGLLRMIESAVDFVFTFPDAQVQHSNGKDGSAGF